MIDLLLILLRPALLVVEGGSRNPFYILCALIAWPVDVLLAHTTFAWLAGWPKKGEWTVSDMLERLCKDTTHMDQRLFIEVARKINRTCPTGRHIKAVAPFEN